LLAAVVVLAVAIIYLFQMRSIEPRSITPSEAFAAGLSGLALSSTMGLGLSIWYWMAYAIARLLFFILPTLPKTLGFDERVIGTFIVVTLSIAVIPCRASSIREKWSKSSRRRDGDPKSDGEKSIATALNQPPQSSHQSPQS
jgi:hypothetical protein